MRNKVEEWKREYVRKYHLIKSVYQMSQEIAMSQTAIRKQCIDEGLETIDTRVKFTAEVKKYVRENMHCQSLVQIAIHTGLEYEQVQSLVNRMKKEGKANPSRDEEAHKYNLCMFLLIGDTVESIIKMCSPDGHLPSDFIEAIEYKDGLMVARAYNNIIGAGNKIKINEGGIIKDMLLKVISERARR